MFGSSAKLLSLHTVSKRANFAFRLTAAKLTSCTNHSASSETTPSIKPLTSLFHYDEKGDHYHCTFMSRRINALPDVPDKSLELLFEELTINTSLNPENILNYKKEKYILPTLSDATQKKILDPEVIQHHYKLPSFYNTVKEKLTPGLESFTPKIDPSHLQEIIDNGSPPLVKISMPYLLRIRRHKMKKHKLKKFRKRMIFLHRKLAEIKKKKKEQQLAEYQQNWAKRAANFDPEQQLNGRLLLARKGGYGVPLFPGKGSQ